MGYWSYCSANFGGSRRRWPDPSRVVKSERRSPATSPKKIQKAYENFGSTFIYVYIIYVHTYSPVTPAFGSRIFVSRTVHGPLLYANVTMRMFLAAAAALPAIGCTRWWRCDSDDCVAKVGNEEGWAKTTNIFYGVLRCFKHQKISKVVASKAIYSNHRDLNP